LFDFALGLTTDVQNSSPPLGSARGRVRASQHDAEFQTVTRALRADLSQRERGLIYFAVASDSMIPNTLPSGSLK
jgi:hypothetical protein